MGPEAIIEAVILNLTGVKLSFNVQNVTEEATIEKPLPVRQVCHGISFPQTPGIAAKWEKHIATEGLIFPTLWQCAIGFSKFWRAYSAEEHKAPALRGL